MVIYHSYVSLPEGIKGNVHSWHWYTKLLWSVLIAILGRFLLYHYWKLQSCTPWPWSLKPLASWCSHQNSVGKSMFTSQTIWFIEFRNIGWSQGFISPRTGLRENAQEHLSLLKKNNSIHWLDYSWFTFPLFDGDLTSMDIPHNSIQHFFQFMVCFLGRYPPQHSP